MTAWPHERAQIANFLFIPMRGMFFGTNPICDFIIAMRRFWEEPEDFGRSPILYLILMTGIIVPWNVAEISFWGLSAWAQLGEKRSHPLPYERGLMTRFPIYSLRGMQRLQFPVMHTDVTRSDPALTRKLRVCSIDGRVFWHLWRRVLCFSNIYANPEISDILCWCLNFLRRFWKEQWLYILIFVETAGFRTFMQTLRFPTFYVDASMSLRRFFKNSASLNSELPYIYIYIDLVCD